MSATELPANAPAACPGPSSADAGKASPCATCPNRTACADGSLKAALSADAAAVAANLANVRHVVLVLSGKGGVGKSTVSAQMALHLARRGFDVGLLDVDICGPSVPRMLGVESGSVLMTASGWEPVAAAVHETSGDGGSDNADADMGDGVGSLVVMSSGFLLPEKDEAVVWRGPRKNGLIKQFLKDVAWGELDFLIIDTPPGTSDEHISLAQLLPHGRSADGAVVVSTPQEVALADVRKELSFCNKVSVPVLGVVENMSRLVAPVATAQQSPTSTGIAMLVDSRDGRDVTQQVLAALPADLARHLAVSVGVLPPGYDGDGAAGMAKKYGLNFLGSVPLDPSVADAAERGCLARAVGGSAGARALGAIVDQILKAQGEPAHARV